MPPLRTPRCRLCALLLGAMLAPLAGCPPAGTLPGGCGKDTDCKGVRICVLKACVDPPGRGGDRANAAAEDGGIAAPTDAAAGDGGGDDAAVAAPLGASEQFHVDPAHTGRSRFRVPTTAPREVAHVAAGKAVTSSAAIADGMVVFGAHDRSIYGAALDGSVLWRVPTDDLVWSSPALGPDGMVYVGSDDDRLYAISLADGAVRWRFTAGPCRVSVGTGPEGARCDVDGVAVAPDGTIYAVADGLYALDRAGTLLWKFSPGPAVHCATHPAIGPDGTVYFGCHDDALYAIGADGQKRWEFRSADDVDSSPAIAADGTIYFGSDDRKLYALTPTGQLKFAVATGGAVRSSPAIAADGTVYVGSFDGTLYAIQPSGIVAWTFRAADRILSSPLVDADGTVVVGAQDDRLYALDGEGRLLWSVLLDGDVDGTPALGEDGTLYVGADDRALHMLR